MARLRLGPRLAAAALVAAGLGMTMREPPIAARTREMKAGYHVIAGDFHVHSFPGDGLLPPWDLAPEARRRHLDVIALTNHNSTHSWHLSQWLARMIPPAPGALVIPGEEYTAVGFHLAIVGITEPLDWRQRAADAAAAAHAQGAVAILAHPSKRTATFLDDADLRAVDGVEVAFPATRGMDQSRREFLASHARAIRIHPAIAAIGSTDFHHLAPLGLNRTFLLVTEPTQAGVLDAIRAGRTVGCDGLGVAYGPDALVAMLREACARDAKDPPEGQTRVQRAATWLVWLGLMALVMLGADDADLR